MQSAPQHQAGVNYEYWPSSGWIPQAVMQNTLQTDSPELMTAEQVKAMSIGDHQHLWRVSRPASHHVGMHCCLFFFSSVEFCFQEDITTFENGPEVFYRLLKLLPPETIGLCLSL